MSTSTSNRRRRMGRNEEKTNLDNLVPSSGDDDRVERIRGESDARDPFGVTVLGDVELAFSKGVPKLDGSISGSRDDLSVIGGEGDGEDVGGVTDESTSRQSGVEIPKSKSLVPRGGEGELTVGGDDDVGDESVVSGEDSLGESERSLVSSELPPNFVCRKSTIIIDGSEERRI